MNNLVESQNNYLKLKINNFNCDDTLKEAMLYTLLLPSKNFRSQLFYEAVAASQNFKPENFLNIGAAIEMIHTYSLIHDDLPCMDDDSLRRGEKTSHLVFGEGVAVLTGDALLTHAFEVLFDNEQIDNTKKIKLIQATVNACGANSGMINGQMLDITNSNKSNLDLIYVQKTGKLISLSLKFAAILTDGDDLSLIGEQIGYFFQLQDDFLDLFGDEQVLGKTIGSDVKNQKLTEDNFEKANAKLEKEYTNLLAITENHKWLQSIIIKIKARKV